jgi:predicted amidohydrolase YtcJ
MQAPPDLVIMNANLFQPGLGLQRGVAVLVRGGRVVAVCAEAPSGGSHGPATRVVNARGRLVTPGLHDAHLHFTDGGISLLRVDCRASSVAELLGRVRARAGTLGPDAWVVGRGWDERSLAEGRPPRMDELDDAAGGRPVLLRRVCGHAAVANGRALALAGLAPPAVDPPGGRVGRTSDGTPDGALFETAVDRAMAAVPAPTDAERLEGLRLCLAQARRLGLTSVEDERGDPALYLQLAREGALTCRVRIWHRITTPLEELVAWREAFPADDRLRPGLLKGYLDGSLGARTAWFHEPYADDPSTCGMPVLTAEELAALAPERDRAGFQIGLHAIGDRAVRVALEQFAALRTAGGNPDARHRIEHAQHVRPEDMPRFAQAGAVASMQPSHLSSDAGMVTPRLGSERLAGAYAWRSLLASGAIVAFGSDFPIEPMDPRTSLHAAVTRRPRTGGAALPPAGEAVDMATALTAFTLGSARAAHREHELGTCEPGRLADLVVWGEDLFAMEPDRILQAPVDLTILGGEVVYDREAASAAQGPG